MGSAGSRRATAFGDHIMLIARFRLLVLCLPLAAPALAQYQWTAVPLHPEGASGSSANAAWGDRQGGTIGDSFNLGHAAIWQGAAEPWIDLTPAWARASFLNGIHGDTQAGQVLIGSHAFHAALWSGTAESFVDLHPLDGYRDSDARAVYGDMQAGFAIHTQTGKRHAAVWNGTAESFVDLHPANSTQSRALATDGVMQGGWASLPGGGDSEAVIWSGTAESVVNLAPSDARNAQVNAMAPGVQVGSVQPRDSGTTAAVWYGDAQSLVYLQPEGVTWSEIYGTDGTHHVGKALFGGSSHAYLWLGESGGVDLASYLPPEYSTSVALSVSSLGNTLYVTGFVDPPIGQNQAWLWVGTVPSPGTLPAVGGAFLFLGKGRRRR